MGSSHYQDDQDPSSLFDSKFSNLAGQIESMSRELDNMAELYKIKNWGRDQLKDDESQIDGQKIINKNLTSNGIVPEMNILNESSTSLFNCEENSNMSFIGGFSSTLYDGDSNCSFNLNDSFIEKMNNKEAKKQRLVIKLKRITKKYFMVNKLPIKDNKLKKLYLDYEQDRYYFQVYVNDLPKTYQCKQCPKLFNKIASLQFHKRTHTKLPQGKYVLVCFLLIYPIFHLGYNVGDFARRFSNHAAPVEPYIPAAHNKLTENLCPHPTQYTGYVNIEMPLPQPRAGTLVGYGHDSFSIGDLIGEGGFAKVFGAVWENGPLEERDTVLKIQSPANDWEWYILNQVLCRLLETL